MVGLIVHRCGAAVLGGSPCQDSDQPSEIVSYSFEGQVQLVSRQTQIPHSSVALPLLPVGKDTFGAAAHPALAPVVGAILFGELDMMRAFLGQLAFNAVRL